MKLKKYIIRKRQARRFRVKPLRLEVRNELRRYIRDAAAPDTDCLVCLVR